MALYPKFRDVHLYLGLALLLPMLVIAATGILLNHEKTLGLKPDQQQTKNRQAKMQGEQSRDQPGQTIRKQSRTTGAPTLQLASGAAVWTAQEPALNAALEAALERWGDTPLEKIELKHEERYGLVVKVKALEHSPLQGAELFWSVAQQQPVLWKERAPAPVQIDAAGAQRVDWAKVVMDLHTGKIFGAAYGWLWSDLTAAAILVLGISGLVMYGITWSKKRAGRRRQAQAARAVPVNSRPLAPASAPTSPAVEGALG